MNKDVKSKLKANIREYNTHDITNRKKHQNVLLGVSVLAFILPIILIPLSVHLAKFHNIYILSLIIITSNILFAASTIIMLFMLESKIIFTILFVILSIFILDLTTIGITICIGILLTMLKVPGYYMI